MKKIFTLVAMAMMAVGVNAQLISFTADDVADQGTLNGKVFSNGSFSVTVTDGEGKFAVDESNSYFGDAAMMTQFTHRLKTGGKSQTTSGKERWLTLSLPTAGTLKIYARSGNKEGTRAIKVLQNGKELFSANATDAAAISVDIESRISSTNPTGTTTIYPIMSATVAAGEAEIDFPDGAINFYAFELIEGEGPGEDGPGEDNPTPSGASQINFPASTDGITISGTTTWDNTQKYHANTDTPKNISFSNGYTSEGIINDNWAALAVDGGFKAGDIVTVAGYFNNSDGTKQAAVTLFVGEKGEEPTDLWKSDLFINGRSVAENPAEQSYTLEADYATLKLGRANGLTSATRTNVTLLRVSRPTADGLKTILSVVDQENAPVYNLAGQRVNNSYRGVVIKNGKKIVQK